MADEKRLYCLSSDTLDLVKFSLTAGTYVRFSAPGNSMLPCIQDGDVIVVAPCALSGLNVGDVVLVERDDGSLIAHRLIEIGQKGSQKYIRTMGDNTRYPDPVVMPERVLGQVIAVDRGKRTVLLSGRVSRWSGLIRVRRQQLGLRLRHALARRGRLLYIRFLGHLCEEVERGEE